MLTEKLTYEDIVTKTVEALLGAGMKSRSIQNSYCKYYDMLGKYLDARGIRHYDIGSIGEFLQRNEERYRKKEITKHHYCDLKRAIRILIEYVEGDVIVSPEIRHVSKFTLNPLFEEIISEYLAENIFHPNTKDDIVWAIKRFLYYLEQIGHATLHCVEEKHIRQFLLAMSEILSSGSLKNMMCYLKVFLKFAYAKEYIFWDASPMFSVKVRREEKISVVISDAELERTLAQINTKSVMGKRDMAMSKCQRKSEPHAHEFLSHV